MSFPRLIVAGGACLICLVACQSSQPTATPLDTEPGSGEETAPPSEYRKALLWQAMRGLRYDTGRVTIDEPVAATIASPGTRDQAMAEYRRGQALLRQNQRLQAIAAHTRAVLIAPDEPVLYEGLATALLVKQKTAEAIAAYRTALDLDPQFVAARFNLAWALQRLGQLAGAADALREVIRLEPDHAQAHARLAIVLYYLEDDAGAWGQVHAAESLGSSVPPQFRALLARRMPEPGE